MVTIYDLLEVEENASKEEIEKSYQKLILEYQINPALSDEENKENEMILNKLKIAYEIIINDEKRKRYDNDLAKKRAEDLIKNVTSNSNDKEYEKINKSNKNDSDFYGNETEQYKNNQNSVNTEGFEEDVVLTEKEKSEVIKEAKKQFKQNLRKAQKIEEEYNQAYNKAYNDYLKKAGFKSDGRLTLNKIKTIFITVIVLVIICVVFWYIPPIRKMLVNLYEENFIIKSLVDLFNIFLKAIMSIFKN